jgi:hypothetical protein
MIIKEILDMPLVDKILEVIMGSKLAAIATVTPESGQFFQS